jgi:hypothetical protein
MKMPHLIFTVGKNPLPVLVAAKRLGQLYNRPKATALCSEDSEQQYEAVRALSGEFVEWQTQEPVGAYEPDRIESGVRRIMRREGNQGDSFHLHYTGGTKAMGVHAVAGLERVECKSYLDAKAHRMHYAPASVAAAADERQNGWRLSPDDLAKLHGFTPICDKGEEYPWNLASPIVELLRSAAARAEFEAWRRDWEKQFREKQEKQEKGRQWTGWSDAPPKSYWPESAPWPPTQAKEWGEISPKLGEWCGAAFTPQSMALGAMSPKKLKRFYKFLPGFAFERWVYERLKDANPGTGVWPSFEARAPGAQEKCEIDVCVVLGYQLVAVSCTTDSGRGLVKSKGFEVWHRARQIGGDAARAVLVCWMKDDKAEELERDLSADIGADQPPLRTLRIWGAGAIDGDLGEKFCKYIEEDLAWPAMTRPSGRT